MKDELWTAEATGDGISILRYGGSSTAETVHTITEDATGSRRFGVALWRPSPETVVLRLPGETERPLAVSTDTGATFRYCDPIPDAKRQSPNEGRVHPGGWVTFSVDTYGLGRRTTTLWLTRADDGAWVPIRCPSGFRKQDVSVDEDGLWVAGEWEHTDSPDERRAAILHLSFDGQVLGEVVP